MKNLKTQIWLVCLINLLWIGVLLLLMYTSNQQLRKDMRELAMKHEHHLATLDYPINPNKPGMEPGSQCQRCNVALMIGPKGETGLNGRNGTDGHNGTAGIQGPAGRDGVNGTNGAAGRDGVNGTAGRNGTDGATGLTGLTGATGPKGDNQLNPEFGAALHNDSVELFGQSISGVITLSGSSNYTAQQDIHVGNLTLRNGVRLTMNGFKLFVAHTLSLYPESRISADGNNAVGATGGIATPTGTLGGGGAGASATANAAGTAAAAVTFAMCGRGGAGGQGSGARAGGASGLVTFNTAIEGGPYAMSVSPSRNTGRSVATNTLLTTGSGGGSGGGAAAGNQGGGGGGGAGIVSIQANEIVIVGSGTAYFSAIGGRGANFFSGASGAGGGGGGTGGLVEVYSARALPTVGLVIQVQGGSGGNAVGTGTVGSPGSNGLQVLLPYRTN